jgi:hypothetical protein
MRTNNREYGGYVQVAELYTNYICWLHRRSMTNACRRERESWYWRMYTRCTKKLVWTAMSLYHIKTVDCCTNELEMWLKPINNSQGLIQVMIQGEHTVKTMVNYKGDSFRESNITFARNSNVHPWSYSIAMDQLNQGFRTLLPYHGILSAIEALP